MVLILFLIAILWLALRAEWILLGISLIYFFGLAGIVSKCLLKILQYATFVIIGGVNGNNKFIALLGFFIYHLVMGILFSIVLVTSLLICSSFSDNHYGIDFIPYLFVGVFAGIAPSVILTQESQKSVLDAIPLLLDWRYSPVNLVGCIYLLTIPYSINLIFNLNFGLLILGFYGLLIFIALPIYRAYIAFTSLRDLNEDPENLESLLPSVLYRD